MFCLSVVDHVRLDFGQVAQNYSVHARAAERLAGWARRTRLTLLTLLVMAVVAALLELFAPSHSFEISSAVAIGLALTAYVVYLAVGVEGRVHAHRSCAQRLLAIGEQYRSLLTELQDGLVDQASLLRRRDLLLAALQGIYEQPFPLDQPAFESVRLLGGDKVDDKNIDRLLPGSIHTKPASDAA